MSTEHGHATDVVCVGETMALLVPDPPEPGIRAATFRREIGGAESNVAIHLARAGHSVAWRGVVGEDGFGEYVCLRLADEDVTCDVRTDRDRPTGLYLKELGPGGTRVRYYRNGSAGSTLSETDAEAVWRRRPRMMHTTGITPALSASARGLVERLFAEPAPGIVRSFDINYRPALHDGDGAIPAGADLLRALACRADVVFCGLDEAQALWGVHTTGELRALLPEPGLLIVKQGAAGAHAFLGDQVWYQPAPDVAVVEPVGAGDAFAAGVLHGLLHEAPVTECLAEGSALAGSVLAVHGDVPPRAENEGAHATPEGGGRCPAASSAHCTSWSN